MKTRIIQTRFYEDNKVAQLSYEAQNFFMYLLTCQYINISGIFEVADRKIMFEHKCTPNQLSKSKTELTNLGLAKFKDSWIFILNAEKNNKYRNSDSNEIAYQKELQRVPASVQAYFDSSVGSTPDSSVTVLSTVPITNKQEIINNNNNNNNRKTIGKKEIVFSEELCERYKNKDIFYQVVSKSTALRKYKITFKDFVNVLEAIRDWSLENEKKKKDWVATIRKWIVRDKDDYPEFTSKDEAIIHYESTFNMLPDFLK